MVSNLRGDLSGALSAAVITLPMSMGYGIIAFAPLGSEYMPTAALMGAYSAILSGILVSFFGGTPVQINGPKAPLTLVLCAFIADMVSKTPTVSGQGGFQPEMIIGLAGICILFAGICQFFFGLIGAGKIVKYIPQPVLAGFMNGVAILLIVKQIRPILGLDNGINLVEIATHPDLINPVSALVGVATVGTIFLSKRFGKKIPASLTALLTGTILYYGLIEVLGFRLTGPVIGDLGKVMPNPGLVFQTIAGLTSFSLWQLLPDIIAAGFTIGLLASFDSLIASVISDTLTANRHDSKKELIAQGIGNMACGFLGALPAAGSIPRLMANYNAGGRTRLSGFMCAVIICLTIVFFPKSLGLIPLSAIAGVVLFVGITLFDRWSVNLIREICLSFKFHKETFVDILIILCVTIVTVKINLIAAMIVGVMISSGIFFARAGRKIIKGKYDGNQLRSRKMRSQERMEILEKAGSRILIVELQGPLFFGSAETLAGELDKVIPELLYLIISFKWVNDIDSTGANILLQIKKNMENRQKHVLFSYLKENTVLYNFLDKCYARDVLNTPNMFPDTDAALEWAEDHLLAIVKPDNRPGIRFAPEEIALFKNFSAEEFEKVAVGFQLYTFEKGRPVFREGDSNRDLYLLVKGSMDVLMFLPERGKYKRIFTYTAGIVFGEVAFLDGSCRSADVWAHEYSEVICIPYKQFLDMKTEYPEIATKLIINLSSELSHRLRRATEQLKKLEDS